MAFWFAAVSISSLGTSSLQSSGFRHTTFLAWCNQHSRAVQPSEVASYLDGFSALIICYKGVLVCVFQGDFAGVLLQR